MLNASPYVIFSGQAREALEFYQSILGGELRVMLQSQYNPDPAVADLVMHGQLDLPGFSLMANTSHFYAVLARVGVTGRPSLAKSTVA